LGSFVSILPWGGVEIKIISVLLLIYSIFRLSQPITCALPRYVSRA
jgi:hypothetical protein